LVIIPNLATKKRERRRLPEGIKAASPTVFDPWFSRGLWANNEVGARGVLLNGGSTGRYPPPLLPEDFSLWRKFLESMESFGPKRMCSSVTWNSSSGRTWRHIGNYNSTRFLKKLAIL